MILIKRTLPFLFLLIGATIAALAVFADRLGLDPSSGWGSKRIILLIFGVGLAGCAVLYLRYTDAAHSAARKFLNPLVNLPIFRGAAKNHTLIFLSGLLKKYWFSFPILVLVILIYTWFVSSGSMLTWVSPTHYYADLTIGFLKGNLYLPIKVGPDLLRSPNPYDPTPGGSAQGPVDYTYYHGKFYLYWGPVPALILLLIHPLIFWRVGDLQLVFGFVTGIFILECLLAVVIWDRFFGGLPKYILWLSILLVGLAGPVTFMLNNYKGARIYEAAITGGQFFLLGGFFLTLTALGPPVSRWKLVFAGTLWALAVGTRLNLILPVGFLVLMVAWWILGVNHGSLKSMLGLIPLGVPLALGFACLGWYNWARFGSVTESGLFYQLPGAINLQKHYNEFINPIYILQNLFNYFLYPFSVGSKFPYLSAENGNTKAIFSSYPLPAIYSAQAITGLVYLVPFIVFAIIPLARFLNGLFTSKVVQASLDQVELRELNWVTLALSGVCLSVFGFLLSFFWVAMRYLEDVMPALMLLGIIGFWQGCQFLSVKPAWKSLYIAFGLVLALASILISILVALSINGGRFEIIRFFPFIN